MLWSSTSLTKGTELVDMLDHNVYISCNALLYDGRAKRQRILTVLLLRRHRILRTSEVVGGGLASKNSSGQLFQHDELPRLASHSQA